VILSENAYRKHHNFPAKLADLMAAGNLTGNTLHIASVELKSGAFDVPDVREQLQNAADVLNRELPRGKACKLRFAAILAHGRIRRPAMTLQQLKSCRVHFRGTPYRISRVGCGSELRPTIWDPLAA
jgi:hypothetical protein